MAKSKEPIPAPVQPLPTQYDVTDKGSSQFMGMEVSLAEVVKALSEDDKDKIKLMTELNNRELTMISGIKALNENPSLGSKEVVTLIDNILALRVSHDRKGRMELADLIKTSMAGNGQDQQNGIIGGIRQTLGI